MRKKAPIAPHFSFADFFPRRVYIAAAAVRELLDRAYGSEFGLTDPQFRIIGRLKNFGPCTQQAISEATSMEKMAVSRAARGLLERGLIVRRAHSQDRRALVLSLTDEGMALSVRLEARAVELETALLEIWSPEQIVRLKSDLERLTDHARLKMQFVGAEKPQPSPPATRRARGSSRSEPKPDGAPSSLRSS